MDKKKTNSVNEQEQNAFQQVNESVTDKNDTREVSNERVEEANDRINLDMHRDETPDRG